MTADDSPHPSNEPEFEPPKGVRGSSEFRALLNAAGGGNSVRRRPFSGGSGGVVRTGAGESKRIF
jgi:hypothetical protein